jgi:hypothetical protein
MVDTVESHVTVTAFMRTDIFVLQNVDFEEVRLGKSGTTFCANEGLLASVDTHVFLHQIQKDVLLSFYFALLIKFSIFQLTSRRPG